MEMESSWRLESSAVDGRATALTLGLCPRRDVTASGDTRELTGDLRGRMAPLTDQRPWNSSGYGAGICLSFPSPHAPTYIRCPEKRGQLQVVWVVGSSADFL